MQWLHEAVWIWSRVWWVNVAGVFADGGGATTATSADLDRSARLDWRPRFERTEEAVDALRRWLATSALWREALGLPGSEGFDVAAALGAPPLEPEVTQPWLDIVSRERLDAWSAERGVWMLAWRRRPEAISALLARGLGELPDPWRDLEHAWRLAGATHLEHGRLYLGRAGVRLHDGP